MISKRNNAAFIDGANLHKSAAGLGFRIDYTRLRTWLREKHGVETAFVFIGYVESNRALYAFLERAGYELVFKETTRDSEGNVKGNCDADFVLWAVRGYYEGYYEKAILVSSDGDYASLAGFLLARGSLELILSPNDWCSILLLRTGAPIAYVRDVRPHIESDQK